jgi:hypothetical protein
MPAEVTTRVHALACRANANRGLTFTDSHSNDLDLLYPGDDDNDANSDYDPAHDDDGDDNSSTSSDDSNDASANLSAAPIPAELAGVNEPVNITGVADTTPGVDIRTSGVAGGTPGVTETPEPETPELEKYVNELEAELDAEIAGLDSDYSPGNESDTEDDDLDDSFTPINHDEAAAANADAAQEQASADDAIPALHDRDGGASDDEDEESYDGNLERPMSRLRRNRIPNYGHLKDRDGDGSLPTVARPNEFKGGRHQSHVILQSIIMTQYNLKQGIKIFGDKGKKAVLTELQQLYGRDVMTPINKYDLTPEERKGALRYLMFLKESGVEPLRDVDVQTEDPNAAT